MDAKDSSTAAAASSATAPPQYRRPPRLADDTNDVKSSNPPSIAAQKPEPLSESKQKKEQEKKSVIAIPLKDPDALDSGGGIRYKMDLPLSLLRNNFLFHLSDVSNFCVCFWILSFWGELIWLQNIYMIETLLMWFFGF